MYKIYRYYLFSLVLSCFLSLSVSFGQDTSNNIGRVTIASPTAASLGKFGDVPVSFNTGIPNISIPIYTIKAGTLSLPIGLSYHAGGLKVQENASWVGAGWALNAGGVITRTVMGAPDDKGCHGYLGFNNSCTNGYYTDSGYNSYMFVSSDPHAQCSGSTADGHQADDWSFRGGYKDGEPDLYFFNFGNYSGKFYFNDDQTPVLVPETDFKIQPFLQSTIGLSGFIITSQDGVKYYFGIVGNNDTINPLEIGIVSSVQVDPSGSNAAISSWFLNKVVSADGMDSITLRYEKESYSYYATSMFPVLSTEYNATSIDKSGYSVVKNFVQGVRLSEIKFPDGFVTFTKAANPRSDLSIGYAAYSSFTDSANNSSYALGSIKVSNSNGYCKKDSLYYGYFIDSATQNLNGYYNSYNIRWDAYRLRLDSLQESSCDAGIKLPPYKFKYFNERVPRKLSFGIDHWGFSNGVTNNTSLVPTYMIINTSGTVNELFTVNGANRDPAWPAMRGGSLQEIIYPTSGKTTFDFESNDTHVNFSTYSKDQSSGPSVGYDGSTTVSGTFLVTSSNTSIIYEIALSNNLTNGDGHLEVFTEPGHTLIGNFPSLAGPGNTSSFLQLSGSTTYSYTFYKNSTNGTGYGITASVIKWTPANIDSNMMVGGLRIKTITNSDSISHTDDIVTSYSYNSGGSESSGILYSRPVYAQVIRNDIWGKVWGPYCSTGGCASCDATGSHTYYVSPSSVRPMATFQGNHIGYNQVMVSQPSNGYSIYRYYGSNTWDNNYDDVCNRTLYQANTCSTSIPNFPSRPEPFEFLRGELKFEGHYNQAGQSLKDSWYFPAYVSDSVTTPAIAEIGIPGMFTATHYDLQSGKKIKDSVVSTDYDIVHASSLTTRQTVYYESKFHHQPTRKVSFTSTGDTVTTKFKYVGDFQISSCSIPDSTSYYVSLLQSYWTNLDNDIVSCSPQTSSCLNCRYAVYQEFRRSLSLTENKFIRYRRRSFSGPGNLSDACYTTAEAAADTILKPILRLKRYYVNAPIEISIWKNSSLASASFIKYDTATSPVGFAYPGGSELISLNSLSSSFSPAVVSSNTITRDFRYLNESRYKFNNGNVEQVLPHDGIVRSYIWDGLDPKPVANVIGATKDQIAYCSFETSGKGNWSFSGTPSLDYTSPTGKTAYVLNGSNNITKSGLNSSIIYVVTYWTKNTSAFSITGTMTGYPVAGRSVDGWKLFEHRFTGQTSISISGTGSIDELRLYPLGAQMSTYTYVPLVGMQSQCDANNRTVYYEYDKLGRLQIVRDQDKRLVKKICYNYAGQPEDCGSGYFTNVLKTGSFAKNDCGPGYTGTFVIDSVFAGTYASPYGQPYVDSLAQLDVNNNGQAYANAHGSCNCDSATCVAPSQRCISNICYSGTLKCVSSVFNSKTHLWTCTYNYVFDINCGFNFAYTTSSATACTVDAPCH